jgi:hypothetical protein
VLLEHAHDQLALLVDTIVLALIGRTMLARPSSFERRSAYLAGGAARIRT